MLEIKKPLKTPKPNTWSCALPLAQPLAAGTADRLLTPHATWVCGGRLVRKSLCGFFWGNVNRFLTVPDMALIVDELTGTPILNPTSLNAKGKVRKKENLGNRSCCAWAVPPALTPQVVIWAQHRLAEEASQSINPHFPT